MLVIRIWNYFRGYVIIKIEGLTLEKFINLAVTRDIYLWDIIRIDYTTLEAKVGIKGFKELRNIIRRVGCRVGIVKKRGYPFLVYRFKYRKMLAFGFLISLGILFFLTSLIWTIDIVGDEEIKREPIISYLNEMGIKSGIKKTDIDINEIRRVLLRDIDSLSYVNANIKGTKLLIEVKKRDKIPKIIKKNTPCNIVAKQKSVIEKVIAKNGKAIVEKGDIVKKGQVLISGTIEDERFDKPLLVHSEGKVLGRTYYTKLIEEPIIKTIKEETGNKYTTKEIKTGDKRIHLMDGEIPFKEYKEIITVKDPLDIEIIKIPFEIIIHEYREVRVKKIVQNLDSLKEITRVSGIKRLIEKLPKGLEIVSKDVTYQVKDNILITRVSIEVIQEIGEKQEIQYFKEE